VVDRWIHPAILTGLAVIFAIPTIPVILMPQVIKKTSPEQLARWNYRWERKGLYGGSAIQEFVPKWVHGDYLKPEFLENHPVPENRLTVVSGDLICNSYTHHGTRYDYAYNAFTDSQAQIAVFYWPGWELRVDDKLQPDGVSMDNDGLVTIKLSAGTHHAQLCYELSREGKIARVFSNCAIVVWLAILISCLLSRRGSRVDLRPT
jgi:hypothetical protein